MQNYNNFFQLKVLYSNNNFNWVLFDYRLCTILILITKLHSIVEGRIIEVNLTTPNVIGFKKTPDDSVPAGVSGKGSRPPSPRSPSSLASPPALVEAEAKLAEAKKEVSRIRQQMKMERFRCQSAGVVDFSSMYL